MTREVLVGGDVVGEEREPVEGRIAAGVEDEYRGELHDEVKDVPRTGRAKDGADFL